MKTADVLKESRKVCANCRFCALEQMQGQITRQLVCHRMPPTVSMATTPQGIQGMTMFPVVQPTMYCFEWQGREEPSLKISENQDQPGSFRGP